jgi:uncharacterized protein with HEPN domain
MRHDPKKLYEDILRAIDETECFCRHKTIEDFRTDRALQLVIERELEIIGEAVARLQREYSDLAEQITDAYKIVGLRNVLAHGYDILEYEILWDVVENKLPVLKQEIDKLL